MGRSVFYSFHFDKDVMRVQQVRNIGAIDDNAPVSPNDWEQVKRGGDKAIEKWIQDNMNYRQCVVVLVGAETDSRPWVQYEIKKGWEDGRGVMGVHIHNLKCPRTGTSRKGVNPFARFTFRDGRNLSNIVKCYDPSPLFPNQSIADNLEGWVEEAIVIRKNFK